MSTDSCKILASKDCEPCKGGVDPLKGDELAEFDKQLGNGWEVVEEHHLEKVFNFDDFAEALAFTNKVGAVAEDMGHHPDILTTWGKVKVTIFTHKIGGLHEADFVFAARCEQANGD